MFGQIGRRQTGGGVLGQELAPQWRQRRPRHRRRFGLGHRREAAALAGGIGGLIQRLEGAQRCTAVGVDQLDGAQVPAGIGDVHSLEVTEARRDLEAFALQADGPVAAALTALDTAPEGAA